MDNSDSVGGRPQASRNAARNISSGVADLSSASCSASFFARPSEYSPLIIISDCVGVVVLSRSATLFKPLATSKAARNVSGVLRKLLHVQRPSRRLGIDARSAVSG